MFLLERLIGVGLYSLVLILFCFSLVGKSGKKIKRRLFCYSIVLSILAYNFVPYETADLYRIYEYVEAYGKHTFSSFVKTYSPTSDFGLGNILYWVIGRIGIPQLLPTIVTFVCYSCIFYIIYKTAEKNQISGKNVAITLFFYMSLGTYMFVISGIRCMLGISLLSFCFYRESVEKKFNLLHIPLYLIAALIHSFSAVLIAARFVISIFDTKTTPIRKLIYFVFLGAGIVLVFRNFGDYVDEILQKADSYLSGDLYSYVWEYIIAILTCVVIVCVFSKRKNIKEESNIKLNVWLLYEIALFAIALCVCYEFTIFHRLTTYIMPIIALPLLMTALQSNDNSRSEINNRARSVGEIPLNLNSFVVILSVLTLLVTCSRGSLSSLKFFIW